MAADSTQDRFQVIGATPGTADTQSGNDAASAPGAATAPPADQRVLNPVVAGGAPAPAP